MLTLDEPASERKYIYEECSIKRESCVYRKKTSHFLFPHLKLNAMFVDISTTANAKFVKY